MSIEEATVSNIWEMAAIVGILERKGLLLNRKVSVAMGTLSRLLLWIEVSVLR
jgi:hypothetical protein